MPLVNVSPTASTIGGLRDLPVEVTDQNYLWILGMDYQGVCMSGSKIIVVEHPSPCLASVVAFPYAHGIHVGSQIHHIGTAWSEGDVADVAAGEVSNLGQIG
jgi:hypothetical protein